jgi:competence protein ComFB
MFTEIHNTTEDIVFTQITEICDSIAKEGSSDICTCPQCRRDTACYVLNRIPPRYIISNRGVARAEQETIERQQDEADIVTLVYEGIRQVNHNQRPFINHKDINFSRSGQNTPAFIIPTIVGRLFNGTNFEPLTNINVELRRDGEIVPMKDLNWQNPYKVVPNTEGTYTFWPISIPAEKADSHKAFEYAIKVEADGFEVMTHFFTIPVISELQSVNSFSMERTFKLPDLYLFPPGGDEDDEIL